MSLFKDGMMGKPEKAPLRNILLAKEAVNTNIPSSVIVGGALLHKDHWNTSMTYSEVLERYVNVV